MQNMEQSVFRKTFDGTMDDKLPGHMDNKDGVSPVSIKMEPWLDGYGQSSGVTKNSEKSDIYDKLNVFSSLTATADTQQFNENCGNNESETNNDNQMCEKCDATSVLKNSCNCPLSTLTDVKIEKIEIEDDCCVPKDEYSSDLLNMKHCRDTSLYYDITIKDISSNPLANTIMKSDQNELDDNKAQVVVASKIKCSNTYCLQKHRKTELNCLQCSKTFSTKERYIAHVHYAHTKKKMHRCIICPKVCRGSYMLKRHIAIVHQGIKSFLCADCNKSFRYKSTLYKHISSVHAGEEYKCKECKRIFACKEYFDKHINRKHSQLKPIKTQCPDCGKYVDRLSLHYRRVHLKIKSYKCAKCLKSFFSRQELVKHLQHPLGHQEKKMELYQCKFCLKTFDVKQSYLQHWKCQLNAKLFSSEFKCAICSETFASKCLLLAHTRVCKHGHVFFNDPKPQTVVKGTKIHECVECLKNFDSKRKLEKHIALTHNRPKPHKCSQCLECFSTKFKLKQHLEDVHK